MGDACSQSCTTELTVWDQSTSRFHVRLVLCFELDNSRHGDAANHLECTLDDLARAQPEFAGRLRLGEAHQGERTDWVYLTTSPEQKIPWEAKTAQDVIDDKDKGLFGYTYQQLKEAGFPAKAFVHAQFDYHVGEVREGAAPAPVTVIRGFFIEGGLVLSVHFHHCFGDGEMLRKFLEAFAAKTRGEAIAKLGNRDLDFVESCRGSGCSNGIGIGIGIGNGRGMPASYKTLLDKCPEFVDGAMAGPWGPNQHYVRPGGNPEPSYKKTGRIFVFDGDKIKGLVEKVKRNAPSEHNPSPYACLATLFWVHSAKARLDSGEKDEPVWNTRGEATLANPVCWRPKVFREFAAEYYGNAVALVLTHIPTSELIAACTADKAFASLVRLVGKQTHSVDEDFVRTRIDLMLHHPNIRNLQLCMDPRIPQDLSFNTWRDFGADTKWDLCGDRTVVYPDSLRRAQPAWNMAGTLILPARKDSGVYEVCLTIPKPAMDLLCRDSAFMKWVSNVFE